MVVRATQRSNVVGWPANQTHEHGGHAIALLTCQARIELRSQARTGCGILDTEPVRRTCSRAQRERIAPHSQEIYAHCLCCTAVRNTDCVRAPCLLAGLALARQLGKRPQDGPQQTAALFRQCSNDISPLLAQAVDLRHRGSCCAAAWHMRAPGRVGTSLCGFKYSWSLTGDPNLSLRDLGAARLACCRAKLLML